MAYTEVKTPIVYYGGKTAILNHLHDMEPVHEVYTETFFGGGAFFWSKSAVKNETINDRMDIVVNFYRVLKNEFKKLKPMIESTLISKTIHNEALNTIRIHKTGVHVDRVNLAWAFWVATNFAFSNKIGGGYKYSNDMTVSVPDTLAKRKELFTEKLVERIQHAYIENDDAVKILASRNVEKAFHYLDPPYPNADQGHYGGRQRSFSKTDSIRYTFEDYEVLLRWCALECKGKFLLSSYNSEMLDRYTAECGWHKKEITLRVGGSRETNPRLNRKDRTEVLISNYRTPCGTLSLFDDGKKKQAEINDASS